MSENALECIVVTDSSNVRYFSSFTGEGYLIVSELSLVLVTDFRYTEQARLQTEGFEICDSAYLKPGELLGQFKRVGFENKSISFDMYSLFSKNARQMLPIDYALTDLRAVKDSGELECIKKAEQIGDMAFEHILKYIRPGVSERDIALELEFFMRKNGAEALSFNPIAATGAHGSMPHAEPDERLLESNAFIVLDFGCKYNGYCSDMTRTVCLGKASDEMKRVYSVVLRAQLESLEMIKAGAAASDIHKRAQEITDASYPKGFGHSLGHGVGLEIHERPTLSPKNNLPLAAGNVITVEPGIYLNGFCGVRIEDLVLVTGDGAVNFTCSEKNLIEL